MNLGPRRTDSLNSLRLDKSFNSTTRPQLEHHEFKHGYTIKPTGKESINIHSKRLLPQDDQLLTI